MAVDLATIHSHLEQGYFTQEDMDTLGLSGYVSLAEMKAELGTLLSPKVAPQPDDSEAKREAASLAAAQVETQERADREALIASIAEKQEETKQEVLKQNEADEIAERFKEALKADPNVTIT